MATSHSLSDIFPLLAFSGLVAVGHSAREARVETTELFEHSWKNVRKISQIKISVPWIIISK
ncbi:hypothetical protein ACFFQF_27360 [Haladaptatus pallidirubidus]